MVIVFRDIKFIDEEDSYTVYSRKILRAPIFEDFEAFCSTSKILSSNFVESQELI